MELEAVLGRSPLHPSSLVWSKPELVTVESYSPREPRHDGAQLSSVEASSQPGESSRPSHTQEIVHLAYPAGCNAVLATVHIGLKSGSGSSSTTNSSGGVSLTKHVTFDKPPFVGRRHHPITTVAFSACNKFLFAAESVSIPQLRDASILVFHIPTGLRVAILSTANESEEASAESTIAGASHISHLVLSHDGKLVACNADTGLFAWRVDDIFQAFLSSMKESSDATSAITRRDAQDCIFCCPHTFPRSSLKKPGDKHTRNESSYVPSQRPTGPSGAVSIESQLLRESDLIQPFSLTWIVPSHADISQPQTNAEYCLATCGAGFIDVWTIRMGSEKSVNAKPTVQVTAANLGSHAHSTFVRISGDYPNVPVGSEPTSQHHASSYNHIYALTDKGILVILRQSATSIASRTESRKFEVFKWMDILMTSPSSFCLASGLLFIGAAGMGGSASSALNNLLRSADPERETKADSHTSNANIRLRVFELNTLHPLGKLKRMEVNPGHSASMSLSAIDGAADVCCVATVPGLGLKTQVPGRGKTTLVAMGLATRTILIVDFSLGDPDSNKAKGGKGDKVKTVAGGLTPKFGSPLELPSHAGCVWSILPVNPYLSLSSKSTPASFTPLLTKILSDKLSITKDSALADNDDLARFLVAILGNDASSLQLSTVEPETLVTASDDGSVRIWGDDPNRSLTHSSSIILGNDYLHSLSRANAALEDGLLSAFKALQASDSPSLADQITFCGEVRSTIHSLRQELAWRRSNVRPSSVEARLTPDQREDILNAIEALAKCLKMKFQFHDEAKAAVCRPESQPSQLHRSAQAVRALELGYSPALQRPIAKVPDMTNESDACVSRDLAVEQGVGVLDWSVVFAGRADGAVSVLSVGAFASTHERTPERSPSGSSHAEISPSPSSVTASFTAKPSPTGGASGESLRITHVCTIPAHDDEVSSLSFVSRPVTSYITPDDDYGIRLVERDPPSQYFLTPKPLHEQAMPQEDRLLPACPGLLLTASKDGFVHCLDTSDLTMPPLATLQSGYSANAAITSALLIQHPRPHDPRGVSVVAVTANSNSPTITHLPLPPYVDSTDSIARQSSPLPTPNGVVAAPVSFSITQHPALKFTVTVGEGGTLRIYGAPTGQLVKEHRLLLRPKARFAARVASQQFPGLDDRATGADQALVAAALHVNIDPAGSYVSVCLADGRVRILDWVTGSTLVESDEHAAPVLSSHFDWKGQRIYVSSADGCVYVYKLPLEMRQGLARAIRQRVLEAVVGEANQIARGWRWARPVLAKLQYFWYLAFSMYQLIQEDKPKPEELERVFIRLSTWRGTPYCPGPRPTALVKWDEGAVPHIQDVTLCRAWLDGMKDVAAAILRIVDALKSSHIVLYQSITAGKPTSSISSKPPGVRASIERQSLIGLAATKMKRQDQLRAQGLSKLASAVLTLESSVSESMSGSVKGSTDGNAFAAICAAAVAELENERRARYGIPETHQDRTASQSQSQDSGEGKPTSSSGDRKYAPIVSAVPRSKISVLPENLVIKEEENESDEDQGESALADGAPISSEPEEADQLTPARVLQAVSARRRAAWALASDPKASFSLPEGIYVTSGNEYADEVFEDFDSQTSEEKSKPASEPKDIIPGEEKSHSEEKKQDSIERKAFEHITGRRSSSLWSSQLLDELRLNLRESATLEDDIAESCFLESYRFLEENFGLPQSKPIDGHKQVEQESSASHDTTKLVSADSTEGYNTSTKTAAVQTSNVHSAHAETSGASSTSSSRRRPSTHRLRNSFSSLFLQLQELEQEIAASRAASKAKANRGVEPPASQAKSPHKANESSSETQVPLDAHEQPAEKLPAVDFAESTHPVDESQATAVKASDPDPSTSNEGPSTCSSRELTEQDNNREIQRIGHGDHAGIEDTFYDDDFLQEDTFVPPESDTTSAQANVTDRYSYSHIDGIIEAQQKGASETTVTTSEENIPSGKLPQTNCQAIDNPASALSPTVAPSATATVSTTSASVSASKGFFSYEDECLLNPDFTENTELDIELAITSADMPLQESHDQSDLKHSFSAAENSIDAPNAQQEQLDVEDPDTSSCQDASAIDAEQAASLVEPDPAPVALANAPLEADQPTVRGPRLQPSQRSRTLLRSGAQSAKESRMTLAEHRNVLKRLRESVNEVLSIQQTLTQRRVAEQSRLLELTTELGANQDLDEDTRQELEAEIEEITYGLESTEAVAMLYEETLAQMTHSICLAIPAARTELLKAEASMTFQSVLTSVTQAALNLSQSQVLSGSVRSFHQTNALVSASEPEPDELPSAVAMAAASILTATASLQQSTALKGVPTSARSSAAGPAPTTLAMSPATTQRASGAVPKPRSATHKGTASGQSSSISASTLGSQVEHKVQATRAQPKVPSELQVGTPTKTVPTPRPTTQSDPGQKASLSASPAGQSTKPAGRTEKKAPLTAKSGAGGSSSTAANDSSAESKAVSTLSASADLTSSTETLGLDSVTISRGSKKKHKKLGSEAKHVKN